MCLILFAYKSHPNYPLVVAANRDEFYERPTKEAHVWEDYDNILAGRDLVQMGTWMGITNEGRFAALTNYRGQGNVQEYSSSRGEIVADFLKMNAAPHQYLTELQYKKNQFQGYNVLFGNKDQLIYYSNISNEGQELTPGIYGLSNHLLDTPWPKVVNGKKLFKNCLRHETLDENCFFKLLKNNDIAPDHLLPDTGIGLQRERNLSSLFIEIGDYGTRTSTVLFISNGNKIKFVEKSFTSTEYETRTFQF